MTGGEVLYAIILVVVGLGLIAYSAREFKKAADGTERFLALLLTAAGVLLCVAGVLTP